MSRPMTVHTIDSLMANTDEYGDCRLWKGYVANGVPQVFHDGKTVSVRRLILALSGKPLRASDYAKPRCGDGLCVAEDCIKVHTSRQHHRAMSGAQPVAEAIRVAKLTRYAREKRAKLTMEQAREIRASSESGPVLAERYGVHRALIPRIKSGKAWKDHSNPFAGLGGLLRPTQGA